jgi:hypothetical protein
VDRHVEDDTAAHRVVQPPPRQPLRQLDRVVDANRPDIADETVLHRGLDRTVGG